jgi:hypothetical protein
MFPFGSLEKQDQFAIFSNFDQTSYLAVLVNNRSDEQIKAYLLDISRGIAGNIGEYVCITADSAQQAIAKHTGDYWL